MWFALQVIYIAIPVDLKTTVQVTSGTGNRAASGAVRMRSTSAQPNGQVTDRARLDSLPVNIPPHILKLASVCRTEVIGHSRM